VQTTGFELFDTSGWGRTEREQEVSYQRALQGELARSIMAIDAITEARVHLNMAKERIFVEEGEESSASVIVRVLPGQKLTETQITAVIHMVASAVGKLLPANVQVIDSNGNLLSDFMTQEGLDAKVVQTQKEAELGKEKEILLKIQGMLVPVLGFDKYVSRVSVEMDFNKKESVTEAFRDPQPRSTYELTIDQITRGTGPSGVPGVESNLAEPDLFVNGIMSEYHKTEATNNFELTKEVTQETKVGGAIKRLSISVTVDDKPTPVEAEDGTRTLVKEPRTAEEIEKIRTAIASAVGFNADRGDVIEIVNLAFDTSEEWLAGGMSEQEELMEWVTVGAKYLAAVFILLLFYLILVRPILKRLDKAQDLDDEMLGESAIDAQLSAIDIAVGSESGFPKTVEELEREIESELDESVPVDVEAVKSKVMLKKIEESANEDPEMIANLVKALLKGG
jgi:flagellar M-ring protein FliF